MDAAVEANNARYFTELTAGGTIEDRLSDVHGSRRWQRIIQIYAKAERTTLPFYTLKEDAGPDTGGIIITDEHGKKKLNLAHIDRALHRSRHNARRQDSVVRKYAAQILEHGIQQWCRGIPIATESEIPGRHDFIAAATMTEGLFTAAETDPTNIYVITAVEAGLQGVLSLSDRILCFISCIQPTF